MCSGGGGGDSVLMKESLLSPMPRYTFFVETTMRSDAAGLVLTQGNCLWRGRKDKGKEKDEEEEEGDI